MNLAELFQVAVTALEGLTSIEQPDFRLEQAEYNKDEDMWEVVVSYLVDNANKRANALSVLSTGFQYHRIYKKVKIDKGNQVHGFYIFDPKG